MKTVWTLLATGVFALTLPNCANSGGGGQSGTGPFDSRGNYVEAWADNPSKWKKTPGAPSPHEQKTDELPEIATNEQPPSNAVPIASGGAPKPAPVISTTEIKTKPKTTGSTSSTASTKPKPKPIVKAKPKPKAKAVKYVVKSGDSLSAIASRTGSSVSAIQSANGISGTMIRPGQSLTIPKKK
jgi:LysM repeat protein